jgi:hypothetical protein
MVDDVYGKYSENGFELLDFKSFFITSSYQAGAIALALICWLQLLLSVVCIVLMVLTFFKKQDKINKVNFISVLVCTIFSLLYLIEGIVYTTINANTWGDNFSTLSYVPFIIIAVFTVAYFVILKVMPDDLGLKTNEALNTKPATVEEQAEETNQPEEVK